MRIDLNRLGNTYERRLTIAAAAAGAPALQFALPAAVGFAMAISRIEIVNLTAVSSRMGLVFPTTQGTFAANDTGFLISFLQKAVGQGATADPFKLVSAWTAAPTLVGDAVIREVVTDTAAIGGRAVMEWPESDPLVIADSALAQTSLALFNLAAGASAQMAINLRYAAVKSLA